MPYATANELRLLLRHPAFSEDDTARAELLIMLAEGVIEDETGQALASSTDIVVRDGPTRSYKDAANTGSDRLILPRWPVTAVESVTLTRDGEELVHGVDADYTWSASGVVTRIGADWPDHDQAVEVVYTAGHATIPNGVKRIVLRLAASVWDNAGDLTAESLGDHSKTFATETLGMELSAADKKTLGLYRART